jgi:hypothetical protein
MRTIYFYFLFAFRRLSRAGDNASGWRVVRADLLLLLVETRLLFSLVWLCFPNIMDFGTPLGWGLLLGAPIALASFLLKADHGLYLQYAERFRNIPPPTRFLADLVVAAVSIVGAFSPLVVRTILTGKDWWT